MYDRERQTESRQNHCDPELEVAVSVPPLPSMTTSVLKLCGPSLVLRILAGFSSLLTTGLGMPPKAPGSLPGNTGSPFGTVVTCAHYTAHSTSHKQGTLQLCSDLLPQFSPPVISKPGRGGFVHSQLIGVQLFKKWVSFFTLSVLKMLDYHGNRAC